MDWNALAQGVGQNLGPIASVLGALHGGGGAAGTAGALAGLGDVQHDRNQRAYEGVKAFADQLEKIGMDTENWSEEARTEAMQQRLNLLSPKTIAGIYGNPGKADKVMSQAWDAIRQASGRPDSATAQSADRNAQAGQIPALGRQQPNLSLGGASAPGAPLSMGGQPGSGGLSMLGGASASAPQPSAPMRFGPLSPGEKAQRMYQSMQPFFSGMAAGTPGSGGSGGLIPMVGFQNGKPSMHMRVDTSRPLMLDLGDGGPLVSGLYDAATQSFMRTDTRQAVNPKNYYSADRALPIDTIDANGNRVTSVVSRNSSIGQSFAKPVQTKTWTSTGPNGERTEYDIRPGFNGQPNTIVAKRTIGVIPFASMKAEMMGLGIAGKQLSNALSEYKINGYVTLPDGSRYVPNGTVLDQNGNPIAPASGPGGRPTTRQAFKVDVATSLAQTIDEMRQIAKRLEDRYGPISGKISDWAASHGIDLSSDDAEARDVGRLIMNVTSIGGLSTSAHSFMSGDFAQDMDRTVGRMGQDFQLGMGKIDALYDFANRVRTNSSYTALPTKKNASGAGVPTRPQGKAGVPGKPTVKAATAAPASAPSAPSQNMQTLQTIQKLLGGGP